MADYVLSAKVIVDNKDFKNKIDDTKKSVSGLDESTNKYLDTLKKIGKIAGTVFAVDKIIDFGKQIVTTSAELNAMDAQFEQIFQGSQGEEAIKRINEASKDLGVHADRLTSSFNKFGAQVKGAGMEGSKAMEATDKATRLAADAAAFYDISLEDASSSLASFMKGNFEAGDAIGVFTNAKQMDIKANEMYGKSWADLSESERQWLLLDTVQKTYELNGAMGQAQRESDSYENVMGNLKATWGEFLQVIGQPVLQGVIGVMQFLINTITSAIDFVTNFSTTWSNLKSILEQNRTTLIVVGIVIGSLAIAIIAYNASLIAAAIGVGALTAAEKVNIAVTKIATITTKAFGAVMGFITSPITLVILAIGALIAIGVLLYKNWDVVKAKTTEIWTAIKNFFAQTCESIKTTATTVWNSIKSFISGVLNSIKSKFSNIFNSLKGIVSGAFYRVKSAVSSGLYSAYKTVKGFFTRFKSAGYNLVSMIASGIRSAVSKVTSAIKSVVSRVRDFLPFSPAKVGPLKDLDKLNFGGTISMGIDKGAYEVEKAMQNMLTLKTPLNVETTNINKGVESVYNDTGQIKQSNTFILKLGNKSFKAFVNDISDMQNKEIQLEEIYGL